jgi:hypothetical protein
MNEYMKIGKRNGKRKKKRDFPANWVRGISAQPERARVAARQAAQLGPTLRTAQAHALEGGGGNNVGGGGKAVRGDENRSPVKFRGGSSPVVRFCIDRMVARHERR